MGKHNRLGSELSDSFYDIIFLVCCYPHSSLLSSYLWLLLVLSPIPRSGPCPCPFLSLSLKTTHWTDIYASMCTCQHKRVAAFSALIVIGNISNNNRISINIQGLGFSDISFEKIVLQRLVNTDRIDCLPK